MIDHPHVEKSAVGYHVVKGTKVPVYRLWHWHRQGVTVETLMKRYPQLGPARVLDALAFGYDNHDVVNAELATEELMLASFESPQKKLPF